MPNQWWTKVEKSFNGSNSNQNGVVEKHKSVKAIQWKQFKTNQNSAGAINIYRTKKMNFELSLHAKHFT